MTDSPSAVTTTDDLKAAKERLQGFANRVVNEIDLLVRDPDCTTNNAIVAYYRYVRARDRFDELVQNYLG